MSKRNMKEQTKKKEQRVKSDVREDQEGTPAVRKDMDEYWKRFAAENDSEAKVAGQFITDRVSCRGDVFYVRRDTQEVDGKYDPSFRDGNMYRVVHSGRPDSTGRMVLVGIYHRRQGQWFREDPDTGEETYFGEAVEPYTIEHLEECERLVFGNNL